MAAANFKSIKPKVVRLPEASLVKSGPLSTGVRLPLVIEPATDEVDLVDWTKNNRSFIDTKLLEHGALLFRNFNLNLLTDLEPFATTLCSDLFKDNGEHPRQGLHARLLSAGKEDSLAQRKLLQSSLAVEDLVRLCSARRARRRNSDRRQPQSLRTARSAYQRYFPRKADYVRAQLR